MRNIMFNFNGDFRKRVSKKSQTGKYIILTDSEGEKYKVTVSKDGCVISNKL